MTLSITVGAAGNRVPCSTAPDYRCTGTDDDHAIQAGGA
jgi:hypothetical protein